MVDKRDIYDSLRNIACIDEKSNALIESIAQQVDAIPILSDGERKDLLSVPETFLERIYGKDGGWTTRLHIMADNGTPELLQIDPRILSAQNSERDSVIDLLLGSLLGKHTGIVDYVLLERLMSTPMDYQVRRMDSDQMDEMNLFDQKDLSGKTVLDRIVDFAYAIGQYDGAEPDEMLQQIVDAYLQAHTEPGIEPLDDPDAGKIMVPVDQLDPMAFEQL